MAGFNVSDYVGYEQALDEAHRRGIQETDTQLVQSPLEANNYTAIVKATVVMQDGTKYSATGDADDENCGKNIRPHKIRMAETRAKGRALREAINAGGDPDLADAGPNMITVQQQEQMVALAHEKNIPLDRVAQRYEKQNITSMTYTQAAHALRMLEAAEKKPATGPEETKAETEA